MKEIINFLKTIKNKTTQIVTPEVPYYVYFVMGNSSCDMDSFLSSIVYSYFKNVESGLIPKIDERENKKDEDISYNIYDFGNLVYIPIINCSKDLLFSRLDIAELCKKLNLTVDDFFFFDEEIKHINNEIIFKPLEYSQELLNRKSII